ncbi:MAG TPA: hypothetical protein PLR77_07790 [Caldisericia bacterium]|nr:hypothetical protein [Caldisericia bacterium]HPM45282.1 hypothetical protein [Caldisericia bacterium]
MLFCTPVQSANIARMGFGWCYCTIRGTLVTTMNDRVIVTDSNMGRMFLFTLDGHFAGHLGNADECKKNPTFTPSSVCYGGNNIYACCIQEHAVKRYDHFGTLQEKVTSKELGFDGKNPISMAFGTNYFYVVFEGGKIASFEKDWSLVKTIDFDATSCVFKRDKLYVTGKGKVVVFNEELEELEKLGSQGKGFGQLDNPSALSVDENGNVWVADTGNDRVQVFYKSGGFAVWGQTAVSLGQENPGEDPISGRQSPFKPTSIDVSDDFFYVARPDPGQAWAVPKGLVSRKWKNSSLSLVIFEVSKKTYSKYVLPVWRIQQALYPKALVCVVETEDNEKIVLDGQIFEKGPVLKGLLDQPRVLIEELASCIDGKSLQTVQIEIEDGQAVAIAPNPDCVMVSFEVSGSMSPLVVKKLNTARPKPDSFVRLTVPKPSAPNLIYVCLLNAYGSCIGAEVARGS